jgi:predicted nucleic acid-binding protein
MQRVMLDAYAILAWLEEEPGADFVNDLLRRSEAGEVWCGVCALNIGEVYYRTCRKHDVQRADGHLALLLRLPWHIVPVSNDLVWDAAAIKGRDAVSYADAFFIASAYLHTAELVTNDPEIRRLRTRPNILWPGVGDTPKE